MNQEPPTPFNSWNHMYGFYQFPQQCPYSATYWKNSIPPPQMKYPTPWVSWPPQNNQLTPWPQGWIGSPFQWGQFPMPIKYQLL